MPQLGELKTASDIASACKENIAAFNVLERAIEKLCALLSVLVAYVDPAAILLGNQDPSFYEVVLPLMERHLAAHLEGCHSQRVDVKIVPAPTDSALRGVAGLVFEKSFRTEDIVQDS